MNPRPTEPLPIGFFADRRPAHGPCRFAFALDGVVMRLEGLSELLERRLRERYGRYEIAADAATPQGWSVTVHDDADRDYYIQPPERGESNPVLLACDGDGVRFLGYQASGWFDPAAGRGLLVLARGELEPVERAAENYLRACVAWQAATIGGALVHAASAILGGRGYLFYGESGAGKSTLSECNRRATIVSDDLSLVLPASDGRLHLVGSPFRGTYEEGEPVVGTVPLAAGFRIVQDREASVRPVARLRAMAELVGNLPFVADSFATRPDLFARVDRAFGEVPLAHLHFRKDESYWDAILEAGY